MTNRKKVIGIRDITIDEIKELNQNRSVWVNRTLANDRIMESLIFPITGKGIRRSKKEKEENEALEKLSYCSRTSHDTYCKLRARYVTKLFGAPSYGQESFKIEVYDETEVKEEKEQVKVMKRKYHY